MLFIAFCVFISLYFFFDVNYYVRIWLTAAIATVRGKNQRKRLLEEHIFRSICLTTDLDFQFHMNNARYLRDCDFARLAFWIETGIWETLKKLKGSVVVRSSHIRYRKSVELFERYFVKSMLVYWDEKSFYVEHQIVRQRDNFVCAVNISENAVVPSALTPQQVVDQFGLINKPRLLPEVEKIIDANSMNSERMKKLA
ncbi:hypothetical protein ScPMuIL_010277 [Solemya velum]